MDGYLSKPVDRFELYAAVEGEPVSDSSEAAPEVRAFDRAALLERVGGDATLVDEILQIFVADCPARLRDVDEAFVAGSAERLASAAHAIKGAVLNLSAHRVAGAAEALELAGRAGTLDNAGTLVAVLHREVADFVVQVGQASDEGAR